MLKISKSKIKIFLFAYTIILVVVGIFTTMTVVNSTDRSASASDDPRTTYVCTSCGCGMVDYFLDPAAPERRSCCTSDPEGLKFGMTACGTNGGDQPECTVDYNANESITVTNCAGRLIMGYSSEYSGTDITSCMIGSNGYIVETVPNDDAHTYRVIMTPGTCSQIDMQGTGGVCRCTPPELPQIAQCNQTCGGSNNIQCSTGLACTNGVCRLPSNPNSTTCHSSTIVQCNQACDGVDTVCASGLACTSGMCRLPSNPTSTTCLPTSPQVSATSVCPAGQTIPTGTITWTNPAGYTAGAGSEYVIDISTSSNFTTRFAKSIEGINTTTTTEGFRNGTQQLVLNPGTTYYVRVAYMQIPGLYSQTATLNAAQCGTVVQVSCNQECNNTDRLCPTNLSCTNVNGTNRCRLPGNPNSEICQLDNPQTPTLGAVCPVGSQTPVGTISWTESNRGSQGYWINISTTSNFASYWHKFVASGTLTTTSDGFNGYVGVTGALVLNQTTTYYVRVYYVAASLHGPTGTLNTPNCQTPQNPGITIVKDIVGATSYDIGQLATFKIRITNTGNTVFNEVQFRDQYSPSYLRYTGGSATKSNGVTVNDINPLLTTNTSGQVAILNVASTPLGALGVGEYYEFTLRFIVLAPINETCNVGYVDTPVTPEMQDNACISSRNIDTDL